ncbi:hypothetical protein, partial [Cetobacterium sp.]|uniref:hypothetical protein n=1 Tax=Cetobacterium sp. TaxID=2071632 RepID=UPI003F354C10
MTNYLIDTVKPVASTNKSQQLLEGNAKNWAYTTQLILEQHYESLIEVSIGELKNTVTYDEWRAPFRIAKKWAVRNFGRKFRPETFEQTEALITAEFPSRTAQRNNEASTSRVEAGQRPRMTTTETQTSSAPVENASFHKDFPPLPPPEVGPAPKEQRTKKSKRISAPCVNFTPMNEIDMSPTPALRVIEEKPTELEVGNEQQSSLPTDTHKAQIHTPGNTTPMSSIEVELSTYSGSFGEQRSPPEELIFLDTDTDPLTYTSHGTQVSPEIGLVGRTRTRDKTPVTPDDQTTLTRPVRHISTNKKSSDWCLTIRKRFVIIGDSNVSKFPTVIAPDLQMDSYPGANFKHAKDLIKKATITTNVEQLILSFGINNRQQRLKQTAIKQLQSTYREAKI